MKKKEEKNQNGRRKEKNKNDFADFHFPNISRSHYKYVDTAK